MQKPLIVWITINFGKFWKRWEYQTTWPASWEICIQARKQQLELDMEQETGSKLGKENIKAVYCHSAYLTFKQITSCEMPGWMKHKLESRLLGEILINSDMQMTPALWQKVKSWLIGKDSDARTDWGQEEKGQQRMRWVDGITDSTWVGVNSGR